MQPDRTADQAATITVSVVDDAGAKITATSASWELFDERGVSIDAGVVADFDARSDRVTFEIEKGSMALPAGVTTAGREIVVSLSTAAGEVEVRDYFVLVAKRMLVPMLNTFMTYTEALGVRPSFGPTLDGWDAMTEQTARTGALVEAFTRIMRLTFKLPMLDPMLHASSYAAYGTGTDLPFNYTRRVRLDTLSNAEFEALPERFRQALKRAQLVEANIVLGGDVVSKKRQDGILSETVGESAVVFSSKPYLNLPVSRQAYDELKRYIVFRFGIARG